MLRGSLFLPILISALLLLAGCASQPSYRYQYIPGKTAVIRGGRAVAPPQSPPEVQAAIEAGNRIAGLPYRYGAGHGLNKDSVSDAYDCSGATSFVLRATGRLDRPIPSTSFRQFGTRGQGDWISVYARRGHVFLVVAGLRFDTGYGSGARGPQWTTLSRPANDCVIRHPEGL